MKCTFIFCVMSLRKKIFCCPTIVTSAAVTSRSLKTEFGLQISTPNFGACTNDIEQVKCSIGPFNCPSNTIYLKPSEIDTTLCHSPRQVQIGRCGSSLSIDNEGRGKDACTAYPTSCTTSLYNKTSSTCSIVEDQLINSDKFTNYPSCREKISRASSDPATLSRCVLMRGDCVEGREDFLSIGDLSHIHQPCSCHDVPTGICHASSSSTAITAATSFCAVAKYDCPAGYTFMTAIELVTMVDPPRICRLCQQGDGDIDGDGDGDNNTDGRIEILGKVSNVQDQVNFVQKTNIDFMGNGDDDLDDNNHIDSFDSYNYDDTSSDTFSMGWVLGGSISGAFMLTTIGIFYYMRRGIKLDFDVTDTTNTELIIAEGTFI